MLNRKFFQVTMLFHLILIICNSAYSNNLDSLEFFQSFCKTFDNKNEVTSYEDVYSIVIIDYDASFYSDHIIKCHNLGKLSLHFEKDSYKNLKYLFNNLLSESLVEIWLYNFQLDSLPIEITKVKNLISLNFWNITGIRSFPAAINADLNIQQYTFASCTSVDRNFFYEFEFNSKTKVVDFAGLALEKMPKNLKSLSKLESLVLANNNIPIKKKDFKQLENLKFLDVSENLKFKKIPKWLCKKQSLKYLKFLRKNVKESKCKSKYQERLKNMQLKISFE